MTTKCIINKGSYRNKVCKQVIGFKSKNFTVPLNMFINFTHHAISSKNSDDKSILAFLLFTFDKLS
jgi:hypothetical protein